MKTELTKDNLKDLLPKIIEEYQPNEYDDTEEMYELKKKIFNLPYPDMVVFILYCDLQSMAKVGKLFSVSAAAIHHRLQKIKQKLDI